MNIFEGYVGIRLWDGQLVDDVIFSLLLFLFIVFSFVFRTNFQLFVKMRNGRRFYRRSERFFVFYSCFISLNNAVITSWAACFPTQISISYGRRVIMLLWGFGEYLYTFRCCGWCLSGHT